MAFPETVSRAGGLMLNGCQEVPVKIPPLGVRGIWLCTDFMVWERKCSHGTIILGSGGEHAVAAEGSFQVCMLVYDDEWLAQG